MIRRETVTVGSDAELPVFLLDGTPIPVTGLLGGTKEQPKPLGRLGKGFFVQEDNSNAEYNIPPATDRDTWARSHHAAIQQIGKELPPTMMVRPIAAVIFKVEMLKHPALQAFGCEPDYNAWTMEENPRPKCDDPGLRTAAGHIHVGWEGPTNEDRIALVKAMDLLLGYWNIGNDDPMRRKLYGKAGAHRPKEYGIEYRVLGNSWLFENTSYVFDLVISATELVNAGIKFTPEEEKALIEAINNDHKSDIIEKKLAEIYGLKKVQKQTVDNNIRWSTAYADAFLPRAPR